MFFLLRVVICTGNHKAFPLCSWITPPRSFGTRHSLPMCIWRNWSPEGEDQQLKHQSPVPGDSLGGWAIGVGLAGRKDGPCEDPLRHWRAGLAHGVRGTELQQLNPLQGDWNLPELPSGMTRIHSAWGCCAAAFQSRSWTWALLTAQSPGLPQRASGTDRPPKKGGRLPLQEGHSACLSWHPTGSATSSLGCLSD